MHPTTQLALARSRRTDSLRRVETNRTRHQLVVARRAARTAALSAALRATLSPEPSAAAPVCCAA
jgi:sarcosine oxidase gamma subunit